MREIVGEKFGRLVVAREWKNPKGHRVCLCQCECGNDKVAYRSNLLGGKTKSCGCLEEKNRRRFRDIAGRKFGRLTAEHPTDERHAGAVVWRCTCDCGASVDVTGVALLKGQVKSCGCLMAERSDIAGRRFGKLTALNRDGRSASGRAKWACRCDCGNLCSVTASNLKSGHTRSCGCLRGEEYRTMVEGTCLEVIASDKVYKNNVSGVKGVSRHGRSDSWVAVIRFRKRPYYLGEYRTVPEATQARSRAEEQMFQPVIDKYHHLIEK